MPLRPRRRWRVDARDRTAGTKQSQFAQIAIVGQVCLTSLSVNALAIDMMPVTRTPSTPIGVMKCCMLGVRRKGTGSEFANSGLPGAWPGTRSDVNIWPPARLTSKLDGVRRPMLKMYVWKMKAAMCSVNCLRVCQRSLADDVERRKYCNPREVSKVA